MLQLLIRASNLTHLFPAGSEPLARNNSGVIHSGIYYSPGSLRAKLCVEGAKSMYEYCDKNKIPYEKTGKVNLTTFGPNTTANCGSQRRRGSSIGKVVCSSRMSCTATILRFDRGNQNGVPDLRIIEAHEIPKFEPHVKVFHFKCES